MAILLLHRELLSSSHLVDFTSLHNRVLHWCFCSHSIQMLQTFNVSVVFLGADSVLLLKQSLQLMKKCSLQL